MPRVITLILVYLTLVGCSSSEKNSDTPEGAYAIAQDYEKEERFLIEKYSMKVITSKEVRSKGVENVVRAVLRYLADCTDIYISFDVDSLDSSISKGTGTPVGNGLREREAEDFGCRSARVGERVRDGSGPEDLAGHS